MSARPERRGAGGGGREPPGRARGGGAGGRPPGRGAAACERRAAAGSAAMGQQVGRVGEPGAGLQQQPPPQQQQQQPRGPRGSGAGRPAGRRREAAGRAAEGGFNVFAQHGEGPAGPRGEGARAAGSAPLLLWPAGPGGGEERRLGRAGMALGRAGQRCHVPGGTGDAARGVDPARGHGTAPGLFTRTAAPCACELNWGLRFIGGLAARPSGSVTLALSRSV